MTKRKRIVAAAAAVGFVCLALSLAVIVLRRAEGERGVDLELAQSVSADFGARVEELLEPYLKGQPGVRVRVTYRPLAAEEGFSGARGAHLVLRPFEPAEADKVAPLFAADYAVLAYDRSRVAEPPASFPDLVAQALALKAKGDVAYGLALPEETHPLLPFFSDVFWPAAPPREAKATAKEVFTLLGDLRFTYGLSPHACTSDCAARLLAQGQVPFAVLGDWRIPELRRALGERLGVAPLPSLVRGGPPLRSVRRTYGVERAPAVADREASAADGVIAYLRGEGQKRVFATLGKLPLAAPPGAQGGVAEPQAPAQVEQEGALRAPAVSAGWASVRAMEAALAPLWVEFADGRIGAEGAARALVEKIVGIRSSEGVN
ncbi:extracellular solute-binding protein [Sorangium sp. So ce341]|uniref:extracellular solute-binding protein n=1 Tax=Sorangium sp. So ce341 TaxID=3133302 RepID=UPI003F5FC692